MKKKEIKLTEDQIKEMEVLDENCEIAMVAFERASKMMKVAEKNMWHYLYQAFPQIKHPASYNKKSNTIDYYE